MALVKEYFELTKKYNEEYGENTIVLMQVGAFFEVYGLCNPDTGEIFESKIVDFSHICELAVVDKKVNARENCDTKMAGFKDFQIEKYIRKLQEAGFTVVVYVQDEITKNNRSLAGIFSPGTYFHSETTNLTNSIACIWVHYVENKVFLKGKHLIIGVANVDIYTGKTNIYQFKETYSNNPTTYDDLERFISIYNPSEVILISNLPKENEMDYVISYSGIQCSLIHKIYIPSNYAENTHNINKLERIKNCEKQPYQKEILSKFYKNVNLNDFNENVIATQSLCYLLDFIYQHNPHLVNKLAEPMFENSFSRLSLANHTLKQLNIINDGTVHSSKLSCVSNFLNECLTPMGKRKFLYHLLNPLCDEDRLQREYNMVEHMLSILNTSNNGINAGLTGDKLHDFLKSNLSTIRDLSKWERQVFLKKITPKAFHQLYNNVDAILKIYRTLQDDIVLNRYLEEMNINYSSISLFCEEIMQTIKHNLDMQLISDIDQLQNFDVNFINEGVHIELDKKTRKLKESSQMLECIKHYLNYVIDTKTTPDKYNCINKSSCEYVKIHETEKNNYSLIGTNKRIKSLVELLPPTEKTIELICGDVSDNKPYTFQFTISKTLLKGEKHTASNDVIVHEHINKLCKTISAIKLSYKDLIVSAFKEFVTFFEEQQKNLEEIINYITCVDMLFTKASIAKKYKYCKPEIVSNSEKSFVNAKQLRHCLIERFQTNELYVPNDVILGDGDTDGILLYGTNAVGKTSFIKSLGISVIMAQSGLYVPASEFKFKPYNFIFSRIIGNDNIFKGMSTFEVEMSELRTILKLSGENSLILGDELCSGTEIASATSIFVAGIRKLKECKSSFIFATHLHEIVEYDEIKEMTNVKLKHMEVVYNKELDALVYDRKLRDGAGNNMYGLEVCKSLHLPDDFLEDAYEIRMKYYEGTGSMLSLKQSKYNAKKIVGVCEKCGVKMGKEVHHLKHQSKSNKDGYIQDEDGIYHKNNLANLMTLCEACHILEHKENKSGTRRKRVV
jgi:DNA mismatch repair protein MutS